MIFPFVSRGRFDDAIERLRIRDNEYAELLADFKALRIQGASIPEPAPKLERKEPDLVTQAISRAAGNNPALRALMLQEANRARRLGQDDSEIIQNIERGVPDEFGMPA